MKRPAYLGDDDEYVHELEQYATALEERLAGAELELQGLRRELRGERAKTNASWDALRRIAADARKAAARSAPELPGYLQGALLRLALMAAANLPATSSLSHDAFASELLEECRHELYGPGGGA